MILKTFTKQPADVKDYDVLYADWLGETTSGNPGSEVIIERMRGRIGTFVDGADQSDDITMLCFRYKGPGTKTRA